MIDTIVCRSLGPAIAIIGLVLGGVSATICCRSACSPKDADAWQDDG